MQELAHVLDLLQALLRGHREDAGHIIQHVRPHGDLRLELRRSAFEAMIRPAPDLVRQTIAEAMHEARVTPSEVGRVLVTGGSGYIPLFRRDLAETFGGDRLVQRDAFTAVVHGLGVRAQQLWLEASTPAGR